MRKPAQLLLQLFGGAAQPVAAKADRLVTPPNVVAFVTCDLAGKSERELVDHIDARMKLIGFRSTDRSGPKVHGMGHQGITYTRDPQKLSPFPDIMMVHVRDDIKFMDHQGRLVYAGYLNSFLRLRDTQGMRAAMDEYGRHLRREAYIRSF